MRRSGGEYAWSVVAGAVARVGHAVDVDRREVEDVAGHVATELGRGAQAQALLHHGALGDDDRPRREVVVMEAGVVAGHPADEPDLELIVEAQALEDALGGVVADQMGPRLRIGGQTRDDRAQLGAPQRWRRRSSEQPRRVDPQQRLVVLRGRAGEHGDVGAVHELGGPHRPAHGRDGLRPVRRGLVEQLRARAGPPAPRAPRRVRRAAGRAPPARRRRRAGADGERARCRPTPTTRPAATPCSS